MGEKFEKKPVLQSADGELYDSFVKALTLTEPVMDVELIDCKGDIGVLIEHQNFEPKKMLKLLVEQAASKNISPEELQKDVINLISLLNQQVGDFSDSRSQSINKLGAKYSVQLEGNEPDAITWSRLRFMFPHFYFATLPDIYEIEIIIPSVFNRPEFAGLIPVGQDLHENVRKAIIIIHLFCLNSKGILLHANQTLLKKRIQTGLLSDERRVHCLEAKGVVTKQGEISTSTEEALAYVKKEVPTLESEIQWDF